MGYLYENSNPERFQHFCQSLLVKDFPALQCLPVGQRDGGRDGWDPDSRTVLQVKFRRTDEAENADWMIKALEGEVEKVNELAKRGAEKYIMATNARGTAQLDAGRIDRVQKWLDENMPIPSICFWRDEIDRRFDTTDPGLKLKYSEMLSLEDGIELMLNSVLGSERARQNDAIRSFIKTQFDADKTVKFKQVDLSNDLLGLFVDIPARLTYPRLKRNHSSSQASTSDGFRKFLYSMVSSSHRAVLDGGPDGDNVRLVSRVQAPGTGGVSTLRSVGMAEVLLSGSAQDHLKLVVLEGAPGQGKSTLAQYVCQMHRARYLKKDDVLSSVPPEHGQTAFRVPLKVDLRDYARFLGGRSPFSDGQTSSGAAKSLEVFLAQLISFNSGGISFDAYDVVSLLKGAPVLLFLDGLDEVADPSIKEELVESVGEALSRWREFEADIQVVVTSRPSVFGRAPSFERFGFTTLALGNLDDSGIEQYADKWIAARSLDLSESREVQKILSEKLEAPHIRHLTRNPMQLTILLSLIHQRGHSLPDQRTDLYRRYVDLFLTREADKSTQVRNNRDILLGFIQHLAWMLQIQAETSKGAGSITAEDLQELAREFLLRGGNSAKVADDLFGGGLERIFVLVERIQGLYEFEVQPLREYFCAQYLYETAPVGTYLDARQSAAGQLGGDRAQRFEALARNPFWLNVCRFYAGSCMRGETGNLIFSLQEMIGSDDVAVSMHARRVGLALLQDWVFSSVKYPQGDLIRSILDTTGVRLLFSAEGRVIEDCRLAAECGSDVLRDVLFDFVRSHPDDVRVSTVCIALRLNGGRHLYDRFNEWLVGSAGAERTDILFRMFRSGAVGGCEPSSVWGLIVGDGPAGPELVQRTSALLDEQPETAVRSPELVESFMSSVLDGQALHTSSGLPLSLFANVLVGTADVFGGHRRSTFHFFDSPGIALGVPSDEDCTPKSVLEFLEVSFGAQFGADLLAEWPRSAGEWRGVIEHGRQLFGDCWAMMSLALRTAGMAVQGDSSNSASVLFDASTPLGIRVRAARLRRGGTSWWLEQLGSATGEIDRMLWAGVVLMWGSLPNVYALADEVSGVVDALPEERFQALAGTVAYSRQFSKPRADRRKLDEVDLTPFSDRTALLVALAFPGDESSLRYRKSQGKSGPLSRYLEASRVRKELRELEAPKDPEALLEWARSLNQARVAGTIGFSPAEAQLFDGRMAADVAAELVRSAGEFPSMFVNRALFEMQRRYRPQALAGVAADEGWVFH